MPSTFQNTNKRETHIHTTVHNSCSIFSHCRGSSCSILAPWVGQHFRLSNTSLKYPMYQFVSLPFPLQCHFMLLDFFFLLPLWQGSLMYDWSHSAFQYRVLWTLVVLWDPVLDRWAQHGLSHILTTVILQHFFHFNWHTQECFYLIYTGVVCHYFILHCFKCCKFVILVTLSHILQDAVQYSCTVYILLASSAEFLFLQLFVHTHYTSVTMCPLFMFAPCINSIKNTFIIPTDAHYYKNQTVKTI